MFDTGCPICGKWGDADHKCNPRTLKRWENRVERHEKELAKEPQRQVDDEFEYQEIIHREFK